MVVLAPKWGRHHPRSIQMPATGAGSVKGHLSLSTCPTEIALDTGAQVACGVFVFCAAGGVRGLCPLRAPAESLRRACSLQGEGDGDRKDQVGPEETGASQH